MQVGHCVAFDQVSDVCEWALGALWQELVLHLPCFRLGSFASALAAVDETLIDHSELRLIASISNVRRNSGMPEGWNALDVDANVANCSIEIPTPPGLLKMGGIGRWVLQQGDQA